MNERGRPLAKPKVAAIALAALACVSSACGGGPLDLGFAVALKIDFAPAISDAQLTTVHALLFQGSGDETYMQRVDVTGATREERTVYRPNPATEELVISVTATDDNGAIVAEGTTATLRLSPGKTTEVELTLESPSTIGDGGADLAVDGGADLAVDAGVAPSLCPTFTGLACESFEADVTSPWSIYTDNGGSLDEQTGEVYRGKYAGHPSVPALAASGAAHGELIISSLPTTGTLYFRGFFYVTKPPPAGAFDLFRLQEPMSPYNGIALNLFADGTLETEDDFAATAQGPALPLNRWVCLELSVVLASSSAAGGRVAVSIDGTASSALTINGDTIGSPVANQLVAGIYYAAGSTATPAYDYWLDEVAVDTKPIGCSR